jgi:hypothetical protein
MIGQVLVGIANAARDRAVQAVSTMFLVPVAATTMHAAGLSNDIDTASLAHGLLEAGLWLTLAMAALFGGLGGVVAELLSLHGHIELPHRAQRRGSLKRCRLANPRYEIDLGIFSRMLLGATAALALLAVFTPSNPTSLVVNALIAGSAATSVFRLVQGRMLAKAAAKTEKSPRSTAALRAVS